MDDMRGLRVLHSARELERAVVEIARKNRLSDPAGVMSQLCRAANSVGANIAEAMGAATTKERLQSLRRAHRSGWETSYHIRSAWDCGFFAKSEFWRLRDRSAVNLRMINGLIANVEGRSKNAAPDAKPTVGRGTKPKRGS